MTAIGIDTGSTSTDAVVYELEQKKILAFAKSVTTHERLETGIRESLRKLPRELVRDASYLSLSTTLATNACVEGKGENVCLIFIGASREAVEWTLSSYGFESMDYMYFLDGDPTKGIEPDWAALEKILPEIARRYGGAAVAQIGARANDGLYERQAAERIRRFCGMPVTCSYEVFRELNVIKRGAGALLNARMAPVIRDFFDAVHTVLAEDGIALPVFVMRSDGSLVSEEYTLQYPVETLVCGPTASVKGAAELFHEPQALVVDMGGTTSDMAIIRDGRPKIDDEGIRLAGWQTFVRGVSIETLGLGGDSRVRYKNRDISLDSRRALPISILADRNPEILPALEAAAELPHGSIVPLYEHFVLLRERGDAGTFRTESDRHACRLLAGGPMGVPALAKALGTDEYQLRTDALEQSGDVLRCGFTPTDAILLRGDLNPGSSGGAYGRIADSPAARRAAELVLRFLGNATGREPEWILDRVYRSIKEKLYCLLVRMLWEDAHRGSRSVEPPRELEARAKEAFAEAMDPEGIRFYRSAFTTDAVLLGAGAPVHIFLPDVAKALHTRWRVSEYSGVSNALGAVLGSVCVYETVHISADYLGVYADTGEGNFVVYGDRREAYDTLDAAVARAAEIAERKAELRARRCGAKEITAVTHEVRRRSGETIFGTVPMGAEVTACAKGSLL